MERTLVAFDTETTSNRGAPHLVELGAVRFAGGEAIEHFARLVRPPVPIDEEAARVHGIVEEDVASAQEARVVVEDFCEWLGDDWLVAHDARADAQVLGFELARAGLDGPANPLLCSLAIARRVLKDAPDHKLPTLVEHLELECDGLHRALADAVACWKVLEACVERLEKGESAGEARLLQLGAVPVTLATAGPRRPRRRPTQLRRLEEAAREERSVWLVYGGPDDAPARLEVTPRLLYVLGEKSYLEGECQQSGTLKTYRLDRVQKVEA